MEPVLLTVMLATVAELIIEALKPALDPFFGLLNLPEDVNPYLYLSLIFGVALAAIYGADVLAAVGIGPWTVLGMVTTGLFIGRGANFVHNAISRLAGGS